MNCRQVQKLLPLYAGHDLDESRAHLIAAHIHSCVDCAEAAGEYRDACNLLQEVDSPAFSEDVYAGLRRNVLRAIENESSAPGFASWVSSCFRPQLSWALAGGLIVAVALVSIFFATSRQTTPRSAIAVTAAITPPPPREENPSPVPNGNKLAASPGGHRNRVTSARRSRTTDGQSEVETKLRDIAATRETSPNIAAEATELSSADSAQDKTMRLEIQTRDPNIRIIWFTHPDARQASPN